jgi:CRISPR-associated endonuclease/helicase Cas3
MMLISHPEGNGFREKPLEIHLSGVTRLALNDFQRLSLDLKVLSPNVFQHILEVTCLLHDIGKASSYFQKYIRGGRKSLQSNHSLISAIIAWQNLRDHPTAGKYAPLAFKAIQRHHGNLSSFFEMDLGDATHNATLSDIYDDILKQTRNHPAFAEFLDSNGIILAHPGRTGLVSIMEQVVYFDPAVEYDLDTSDAVELFLLMNLLFSLLTDADKHDAARIDPEDKGSLFSLFDLNPRKLIRAIPEKSPLDDIRTSFNSLIETHSEIMPEQRLYSITAPTGTGKTFACMFFARRLYEQLGEKRRLIYCLPYTSIIDQNYDEFMKVLLSNENLSPEQTNSILIKHHHLSDPFEHNQKDDPAYSYQSYLNELMFSGSWSSLCVVSTFVQLFESLIGARQSMVRKLHNIINSVLILDEIQSLPAKYFPLMRAMFQVLAERFHTYILTCTATHPFIYAPGSYIELCKKIDFTHPILNRVRLRIIRHKITVEEFSDSLCLDSVPNALVVMNTKKTAIQCFGILRERYSNTHAVYCLTTLHIPLQRKEVLAQIRRDLKDKKPVILVSTQLIEAGVDISFSRVYRDFGPMDSIIQVAGRCNRSSELGELGGEMFLHHIVGDRGSLSEQVYDPYLLSKTRDCLVQDEYCSLDFPALVESYYASLQIELQAKLLLNAMKELNYDRQVRNTIPIRDFRIIEQEYAFNTVFILYDDPARQALDDILRLQAKLKDAAVLSEDQVSDCKLALARAHRILRPYQLNLTRSELSEYSTDMLFFNPLADNVYYIPFDQVNNCYNDDTGFVTTPTGSGSCLSL